MSAMPAHNQTQRASRRILSAMLAAAALLVAGAADGAETVTLVLDRATVMKMPEKVATIIIGNPLIADVSLQPGGLMVVTGKGFGLTNLIALDRAGAVLMDKTVEVQGPGGDVVVVYRGVERGTYSCTPDCERRITLGDSNAFFDAIINETGARNGMAQAAAPVR